MVTTLLKALAGEKLLHQSYVGAVTVNWVIFRATYAQQTYALSLSCPLRIKKITTTYPGLCIIALGLLLLSAADYCTPHRDQAFGPLAILSMAFLVAYFLTRRAALVFTCGSETLQTRQGHLREIAAMVCALQYNKGSKQSATVPLNITDQYLEEDQLTVALSE